MEPVFREYDPEVCLNCETALGDAVTHCPNCGQRNRQHKRSLLEWLTEGLSTFLHVEGKSVRTLRDLVRPGRLARNYLDGQRQRYVHPLRLMLLGSLVFFAAVAAIDDFDVIGMDESEETQVEINLEETAIPSPTELETADSAASAAAPNAPAGTFAEGLADGLGEPSDDDADASDFDISFGELDAAWDHPLSDDMKLVDLLRSRLIAHDVFERELDSLARRGVDTAGVAQTWIQSLRTAFRRPTIDLEFSLVGRRVAVTPELLATRAPRDAARELVPESSVRRLIVEKVLSLIHDGVESVNDYLIRNLSWAVLLFTPILAFGYKLLYWRRLPYYSQALAFTAINMGVLLLVMAAAVLLATLLRIGWLVPVAALAMAGYIVSAESYTFRYPLWKTLLKSVALSLYGLIAFAVAVLLWLTLAIVLF